VDIKKGWVAEGEEREREKPSPVICLYQCYINCIKKGSPVPFKNNNKKIKNLIKIWAYSLLRHHSDDMLQFDRHIS